MLLTGPLELTPEQSIALAIDTSDIQEAERFVNIAKSNGALMVKQGLRLFSKLGVQGCSELAADNGLDWIADWKLDDIPFTVEGPVQDLNDLVHKPIGLTVHTRAGIETMRAASSIADRR